MKSPRITSLLLCTLVLATGCMPFGKKDKQKNRPEPLPSYVHIQNNNWSDVNVYAVRLGSRYRLGTVIATRKATFRMPRDIINNAGDIQLLVDPIGSRNSYRSPFLHFFPGQDISMTVENHLPISSVAVYD